jgi:hypothetical protein
MSYWAIARCQDGHLFETPFITGVSFKAVRLGPERLQRCPVGKNWVKVTFPAAGDLSAAERETARRNRTSPIP